MSPKWPAHTRNQFDVEDRPQAALYDYGEPYYVPVFSCSGSSSTSSALRSRRLRSTEASAMLTSDFPLKRSASDCRSLRTNRAASRAEKSACSSRTRIAVHKALSTETFISACKLSGE